mmetsp:Transcript_71902/g.210642  ORF Transcript_71902/g.210642 Transcript_71902/m.210642 type:complete len:256 (-) Transcript_71902:1192-1959(-)
MLTCACRDHALQVDLLRLQARLQLVGGGQLLLVVQLRKLLRLHTVADLVAQVLHDHGQDGDDALGLELPLPLPRERGIGGLVRRHLEVGPLLGHRNPLDRSKLDRVVGVVGSQDVARLGKQRDRVLVLRLRLQERLVLSRALSRHVADLSRRRVDRNPGLGLLRPQVVDDVQELLELHLVFLDLPGDFCDCAVDVLVLGVALIALPDVLGALFLQCRHHGVNGRNDLVEVPDISHAELSRQRGQAQAVRAAGRLL